MQKYGWRASELITSEWRCACCGGNAGVNWSDLHGEGMCNICGVPYQLNRDGQPCNLTPEFLAAARAYFRETKAYIGAGVTFSGRDYPECVIGMKLWRDWLKINRPYLLEPRNTR